MTHFARSLSASAAMLLTIMLSAHSAFSQDAPGANPGDAEPSPTSSSRAATPRDPGPDDCPCRWFSVGRCLERAWTGPEIMFGLDLGVSAMEEHGPFGFNNGVGSVTNAGPAWGLRAGVELLPWLALEGRYVGMSDSVRASASPAGGVGFLTSGAEAVVRLTAPLPFVHPYILAGIAYYDVALVGSSGSEFHSSSQAGIPMGVGFDVPLNYHLSVGAEATYHYQIQESYSNVTTNGIDGGDLSTFNAVLRARL